MLDNSASVTQRVTHDFSTTPKPLFASDFARLSRRLVIDALRFHATFPSGQLGDMVRRTVGPPDFDRLRSLTQESDILSQVTGVCPEVSPRRSASRPGIRHATAKSMACVSGLPAIRRGQGVPCDPGPPVSPALSCGSGGTFGSFGVPSLSGTSRNFPTEFFDADLAGFFSS